LAGNHELEIWRRLQSGEHLGLKRRDRQAMKGLIGTTRLFHVSGSMLFIHGYPALKLLHHLHAYRSGTQVTTSTPTTAETRSSPTSPLRRNPSKQK
jgi:hypothetical protein